MISVLYKIQAGSTTPSAWEVWSSGCEERGYGPTEADALADHAKRIAARVADLQSTLKDIEDRKGAAPAIPAVPPDPKGKDK